MISSFGSVVKALKTMCMVVTLTAFSQAHAEVTQQEDTSSNDLRQSLTAEGWYQTMRERAPEAHYQGIFVHQAGNESQTVEIVHGTHQDAIWERLLHLDGPVREVIRQGDAVYCIYPDRSVEQIQQKDSTPFGSNSLGQLNQLQTAYGFRMLGQERIVGRLAMGIQLVPRDKARHVYQMWIDQQTFVPLRTELMTLKGEILERYQFAYFSPVETLSVDAFAPKTPGVELAEAPQDEVLKSTPEDVIEWRLNWLPVGFADQGAKGYAPKLSARRIYSDGIVMFSVFVEAVDEIKDQGFARVGPTVLSVMHKDWQDQTHRITVVGEIPAATAKRIAESVELL
ncbi:hypothetical protein HF888_04865 [Bermanella marisrubri]|uniref:Sigma factor algU negative regulatory protein MucB n=1 Tax=Bermanella marisrubri TaxID=207949 RepID=Q1N1C1_9GAMM|nr:MucB/RseB C-terminal domain-containing protein [Bermanella marisrubri]EAT12129.1 sigma factor algU negative regulatory protein MucB [Oceanobacter sp. RED65] [Bermanella marisrubri]QIZ83592.1 hypothetical protein HF888_04865 [Bermanella marisrubri]